MKIGGSLLKHPEKIRRILELLAETGKKVLVIPGGGVFADTVRKVSEELKLTDSAAHKMAVLAMDQYGFLLNSLYPEAVLCRTLMEVKKISSRGKLPILLPSNLIFSTDALKHSWEVTSDSISCYIASLLCAPKLVLVKDVDGIFEKDPKKKRNAKLLHEISCETLSRICSCVDNYLPKLLLRRFVTQCFIVNGMYPERVLKVLEEKKTLCTKILI